MHKNIRLLATFTLTLTALHLGIQPSHGNPTSLCQEAVQSVRSQIQTGRNLEILPTIKRNAAAVYADAPIGRPDEYVIPLRGAESLNILSSPQLMTNLARQIITAVFR